MKYLIAIVVILLWLLAVRALAYPLFRGDFKLDGIVDIQDYSLFQMSLNRGGPNVVCWGYIDSYVDWPKEIRWDSAGCSLDEDFKVEPTEIVCGTIKGRESNGLMMDLNLKLNYRRKKNDR